MAKYVTDFLGNGIFKPRMRKELKENLEIGTLVGLDETTGMLVKATNANAGVVKAIGVITTGSLPTPESPRYWKGTDILNAGESQELYQHFVIGGIPAEEINFTTAKYGDAVYLGLDGKVTTTKPSTSNDLIQVVGYVADPVRQEIVCNLFAIPSEKVTP